MKGNVFVLGLFTLTSIISGIFYLRYYFLFRGREYRSNKHGDLMGHNRANSFASPGGSPAGIPASIENNDSRSLLSCCIMYLFHK